MTGDAKIDMIKAPKERNGHVMRDLQSHWKMTLEIVNQFKSYLVK